MATANITPIFPLTPKVAFGKVITANTATDGTGTVVTVYTAGANGSRIDTILAWHLGTNIAGVIRLFINNGSDPTVATNNTLWQELAMAANTVSQVAASVQVFGYGITLPASYKITMTCGTTVATGYQVTCIGGDY